ncbi:hypothetical protein [Streptomyces sp. Y1]|uniref:Uncharacterized protein n=1 Tax=Streptomyces sp. Y1 TaxID=3238634 RepID=A0AB39TUK6_9ACTN
MGTETRRLCVEVFPTSQNYIESTSTALTSLPANEVGRGGVDLGDREPDEAKGCVELGGAVEAVGVEGEGDLVQVVADPGQLGAGAGQFVDCAVESVLRIARTETAGVVQTAGRAETRDGLVAAGGGAADLFVLGGVLSDGHTMRALLRVAVAAAWLACGSA